VIGPACWPATSLSGCGPPDEPARRTSAAGQAERLRRRWPDRLVFSVGTESTMFMRGIISGRTFRRRHANVFREVRAGRHVAPLEAFLAAANRNVRRDMSFS
jgi:hypothetical protein